ncbi:MAG: hypothetical protein ACRDJH_03010 [Thermomicrobiales bacterium]
MNTDVDIRKLPMVSPEDDDETFWRKAAAFGIHRPEQIDPDQAWFWTRTWITGEIEAEIDRAEGRYTRYYSDEEFLAALRQRAKNADV